MDVFPPDSDAPSGDVPDAGAASLRAEPRDSMLLMATLRRANGAEVPIKVRNLSSGGLMAEVQAGLLRDERIEVELRGIGIVPGRIAWIAGGRIGLTFDHAVDHKKARRPITGAPHPPLLRTVRTAWRPAVR